MLNIFIYIKKYLKIFIENIDTVNTGWNPAGFKIAPGILPSRSS